MSAPTPIDIRKARAYLQGAGIASHEISPRRFAASAAEMGKGYGATLKYLVLLLSGGSGDGPSRIATANKNRIDPIRALGDNTPSQEMEYDNVQSGS